MAFFVSSAICFLHTILYTTKQRSTDRFTSTVENYAHYRPRYPQDVIRRLEEQCALQDSWTVADIGSGTGISSELFLRYGCRVIAVEPNEAMRLRAERDLSTNERFSSVDGTAEATGIECESVDLVVAGQAFHWFEMNKAKTEFRRISKPTGFISLMWNERDLASTLVSDYEKMLEELAVDYTRACQQMVDVDTIRTFFHPSHFSEFTSSHSQRLDFDAFKGRLLSCSYAPPSGHPNLEQILQRLRQVFEKHQRGGCVYFPYLCRQFIGPVSP